jgi:hydrogenase maturation protease
LASYVDRLEVDGRTYQPWQEAEERSFTSDALDPLSLGTVQTIDFSFPAGESVEQLRNSQANLPGEIVRQWQSLAASLQMRVQHCNNDVIKLTVRVENRTAFNSDAQDQPTRDKALLHSLVSAHTILGTENGEFLSLLEPPAGFEDLARSCENTGAWPVLAGDDATMMLASPIILYDYPQIAAESAGNLFDGTEIDEILSLRILTLTDAEKKEIRQSDERARQVLERTENIPDEQFMKLHGVLRGLSVLKEDPQ